jgi:cation transport ATPase
MNEHQKNKLTIEDELADFTDRILNDDFAKNDENSLSADPDLHALERTALRLKNAFHDDGPSKTVIQRMRQNIAMQQQQTEKAKSKPFWKNWIPAKQKWHSQRSRRRFSMAISLALLAALMLVSIPFLNGNSTDQPATSVQNLNVSLVIVFSGLILLAFWIDRRKR